MENEKEKIVNSENESNQSESSNKDNNINKDDEVTKKIIFSLCYLWGILFFLPLVLYKGDADATRHANNGLVLLLFSVIGNAILGIITRFLWFFSIIAGVYSLCILLLGILGIVYVVTDQNKDLPVISKIKLLK